MTATANAPISMKLQRQFHALDTDQDGYIDWSDYERMLQRYRGAYALEESDRKVQALRDGYSALWRELLNRAPDQQRLSATQYVAASQDMRTGDFDRTEHVSHAVFDIMDVDGDGQITREEFSRLLEVWSVTAPEAMQTFDRMDANGDGVISRQEFLDAVRQFYHSDDPEVPGSHFFGNVA
ncbi:EF-hand domain-containing protein [Streptomyces sp. G44]|uniref:EF-hand domain-containing protein n=1 Tax=Streptomyces sp. G44 TaxID=2807632 RepID=UPI00196212EC|nr:EF-hand domain-containing protein [Streptomyces sp. G44]MBM7167612.1 EF-hand domain-containing protein [Streptomyces sp. G44]